MRIIRDNQYVAVRQKRAKYSAVFGFLALVGTFPVAFIMQGNTGFVLLTYMLLLGGFVLFNRGMRGVGKWSHNQRHAREDLALDTHLNDLSDRHTLIHYAQVDGGIIDHLLVGPGGVLVITTSDFPGEVVVQDDRWRKGGPMLSRMFSFSGPQLGIPTRKADKDFFLAETVLEQAEQDIDIYTAIVFTASTVDLTVNGSSHPVMPVDELANFIRDIEPDSEFSTADRDAVVALFGKTGQAVTPVKTTTRRPVKVKKRAA
jgi:nuclease-like protein